MIDYYPDCSEEWLGNDYAKFRWNLNQLQQLNSSLTIGANNDIGALSPTNCRNKFMTLILTQIRVSSISLEQSANQVKFEAENWFAQTLVVDVKRIVFRATSQEITISSQTNKVLLVDVALIWSTASRISSQIPQFQLAKVNISLASYSTLNYYKIILPVCRSAD